MRFIIFFISLIISINLSAQTGKVYPNTNIKKGSLKNGLTYYIYKNPSCKGKRSFYLIQNVGAILEEDNQNGISHFLEHMCFNGTKYFPNDALFEMFDAKNLRGCVNANTGIDQTVYHFIDVPTKYSSLCDKCLLAMRDWCDRVTFAQEKINSERLVILEEKRTRNTFRTRFMWSNAKATLCNSKYNKRDIIGTEEVIKSVNRKDFIEYYNTWYRPDLQAIVVIGDLDIYEMEKKIKNLFSSMTVRKNPKERYHINVPNNKEIVYKKIIDKESELSQIRIKYRHKTKYDIQTKYHRKIINLIIRRRLEKIFKKDKDTPIKSLNILSKAIAQGYYNYGIEVGYKKGKAKEAIRLAVSINKEILEKGFTQKEYNGVVKDLIDALTAYKNSYNYLSNNIHFDRIKKNFINKEDILDFKTELKKFKKIVSNTNIEDLKSIVNNLYSGSNKSIVIVDKNDENILTKEEILDIEKNTSSKEYIEEDDKKDKITLPSLKKKYKTIKKEDLGIENVSMWTLENGAKVVFKECNTNGNVIAIRAYSKGGYYSLNETQMLNAKLYRNLDDCISLNNLSIDDFIQFKKDNKIAHSINITPTSEYMMFKCKYKNVTETFKLLYNLFENPTFDKKSFERLKGFYINGWKSTKDLYQFKLSDTIYQLRFGNKYKYINEQNLKDVSVEEFEKAYRNVFSNARNFVFEIVGGISQSKAKVLAQIYIGAIKSNKEKEIYKRPVSQFPKGYTKVRLKYDMISKKAGVKHILNMSKKLTKKEQICYFGIIAQYLQDKLNKVIRTLESGTYGVQVNSELSDDDTYNYGFSIDFDCDPERAEDLNKTLKMALGVIKENGIQNIDLKLLKKPYEKIKRVDADKVVKGMKYYLKVIKTYVENGEDITNPNVTRETIDEIDLDYVNKTLKEFLENADVIDLIYFPK